MLTLRRASVCVRAYRLQIAAEGRSRYQVRVRPRLCRTPRAAAAVHASRRAVRLSLQNTLVGRIADYMREVGEPVSLTQCTEALRDVFPDLKKPDGTHYRGGVERAIHGALWSTGVFKKNEVRLSTWWSRCVTIVMRRARVCARVTRGRGCDRPASPQADMWVLKEDDAAEYERRLTARFQEKSKKRKNLSSGAKITLNPPKKVRRKYMRRSGKRGDVVQLLANFSQKHKDALDNAVHDDPTVEPPVELTTIFKNPFKVCHGCGGGGAGAGAGGGGGCVCFLTTTGR